MRFLLCRDGCVSPAKGHQKLATQDLQQFHLEDQIAVRRDFSADGSVAIGQPGRDVQQPLVTRFHELKCFRPAGNDLADTKARRLSTLNGAIKDSPIRKGAVIVDRDGIHVSGGDACIRPRGQNAILQSAGGGHHPGWRNGRCGRWEAGALGCLGRGLSDSLLLRWGFGLAGREAKQQGGGQSKAKGLHGIKKMG